MTCKDGTLCHPNQILRQTTSNSYDHWPGMFTVGRNFPIKAGGRSSCGKFAISVIRVSGGPCSQNSCQTSLGKNKRCCSLYNSEIEMGMKPIKHIELCEVNIWGRAVENLAGAPWANTLPPKHLPVDTIGCQEQCDGWNQTYLWGSGQLASWVWSVWGAVGRISTRGRGRRIQRAPAGLPPPS